jgi:tRNA A-37 threonylcarbamoyl transferase component Bud32
VTRHAAVEIAPGTEVRGFEVEARLGAGGFATVYRARRGERRYALKFIRTTLAGRWAQREVDILQRLAHPNVVRFEGCGFWPDDTREYSVVIMDYVEGRRLDEWAEQENPDARQVAHQVLGVGRALAALHREKLVHRDVKEPNIVVRASDGEAVLVDFGVAGGEQLRRVTRDVLPPCTPEYRAPEAWDFFRKNAHAGQAHYEPGPGDDVYALGVVLYWLLTGRLPCEGATLDELVEATLHQVPTPPRVLNPRVPEALSAVCMRMLEKQPEQRYRDGEAVCAAVTEALAGADAEWGVPLCEAHEADKVTTLEEPAKAGDDDGVDRALRKARHAYERPRRGRRPGAVPPAEPPAPVKVAAPSPEPVDASRVTTPSRGAGPGVAVRVGLGVLAVAVGLGAAWLGTRTPRGAVQAAVPEPTWEIGWKVAPPWKPPEATGPQLSGREAEQQVPSPLHEKGEASVTKPQQKQRKKALGPVGKAVRAAVPCMALACTGPQVRPMPPAEECPPGAAAAMAERGITEGSVAYDPTFKEGGLGVITVKEGWTTGWRNTGRVEGLGSRDVLSGRILFCGERVCIRFTEVRLKKENRTIPICLEALGADYRTRGVEREPESTEGNVIIPRNVSVEPVKRFE